jgi:hypothetical protein
LCAHWRYCCCCPLPFFRCVFDRYASHFQSPPNQRSKVFN